MSVPKGGLAVRRSLCTVMFVSWVNLGACSLLGGQQTAKPAFEHEVQRKGVDELRGGACRMRDFM